MDTMKQTITPAIADEMLKLNLNNRNIRPKHVSMLAAAILRGEWRLNGASIVFDEHGHLLDGQHRLRAVIESGVSIETIIVRGVPRSVMPTIDTGSRRGAADTLTLNNFRYGVSMAAAIRKIVPMLRDEWFGASAVLTNDQVLKAAHRCVDVLDPVVSKIRGCGNFRILCGAPNHLAALVYVTTVAGNHQSSVAMNDLLCKAVAGGNEVGDPARALRDAWLRDRLRYARKLESRNKLLTIIRAYNAEYRGRRIRVLKTRVRADADADLLRPVGIVRADLAEMADYLGV